MNFSVDFLYLCLFFPLWVCMLIFCNSALFSLKSRRVATAGTLIGCLFSMIFTLFTFIKNFSYENNLMLFSINGTGIHFGIYINSMNSILLFVASLFIAISCLHTFFKYKNEQFFYKYVFLLNLLLFSLICFFVSSNILQLFIFFSLIFTIFYVLENLTNASHERAKNFLVINKIGDFALLVPVCLLFYFDNFYSFDSNEVILQLSDLRNTFFGIQSVSDANIFALICTMCVLAILIKTILVFIHPLKLKSSVFLLAGVCLTTGLYWINVLSPLFYYFEHLKIITLIIAIYFTLIAGLTLYLKYFKHDFVVRINNSSYVFFKNAYLGLANVINWFDEKILDKTYENISKMTMWFSGCIKITSDKNTLFALIFNIIGIAFLIITAWLIYILTMKG